MAFDLVAKLTLQDDFSKKLNRIFKDMDRFKDNVNKAAHSSTDMAKKFSSAGTIASKSINKVSETTSRMQNMFSRAGDLSRNSLRMIGKGGESMRNVLASASDATKRKIESIGRVTEPLRNKFSQASDKIRNSLNKAIPGDGLKNKISNIGRSVGGLPGKFAQATNKIRSSLKSGIETPAISAKGAIVGIATAITGSLGAVNLFEAGMNRLSTLENSKLSLGVMMGDAKEASVFMDEVLAFAKKTPFAFPDLAESARNLYAFGMDKAKVIPTLKAIGDAAAATGKGQEGLNQVTDAFGAMQIAGKVSMEEINRLQSGGVPALKILANQSGMSAAAMKKSISDGALESDKAIQQLVEGMQKGTQGIAGETKSMAGIMEKSKKTWTGTVDSMKSAISSTMATLLEPAKPKLQAAMTWFGKTFSKIPDMAKKFAPLIKVIGVFVASVTGIFAVIGAFAALSGALTFLLGPIGLIALGVTALATGFVLAYKKIEPFRKAIDKIKGGFEGFYSLIQGNEGKGASLLMSMGISKETYFKIKTFADGIVKAGEKLKDAKGLISGFFYTLQNGGTAEGFKKMLESGLDLKQIKKVYEFANETRTAFNNLKGIYDVAVEKLEVMGGKIADAMTQVQSIFKMSMGDDQGGIDLAKRMGMSDEQISKMLDFSEKVKDVFSTVKTAFGELKTFFQDKAAELAPTLDVLAEAFSVGKEFIVSVFQTLWTVLEPIISALKNALMIVADVVVMAWTNVIAPAIRFVIKMFETAWTIIGPILKLLGSAIGLAFEILRIAWQTILKPVAKYLTGEFKQALEKLTPALDGLKGAFEGIGKMIEWGAGWFDTFRVSLSKFKVPNWLSKLGGGGTVKFENSGGSEKKGEGRYNGIKYVPRDNTPYRLHRGERVLTAKENKEHNKGGGGRSFVINMNGTVIREEADVDRLAEKMVRKFIAAGEGGA